MTAPERVPAPAKRPRTLRVFPRRTSMTPTDAMAFVGNPPLWLPEADEVHVSVAFTWDIPAAERLRLAWGQYYPDVMIGGPAFDAGGGDFVAGRYLREGATITSRGCNRRCPWCLVPPREGRLRLLPITPGHIVLDNNLLQTGRAHMAAVFQMLREQPKAATLSGGLDARLVDDWVAGELESMRIEQLFLAADLDASLPALERALGRLGFLPRKKLRCFVLIAFNETMTQSETRLEEVWNMGAMPFAQLYQPPDEHIEYPLEWKRLARKWSRPAAMAASHA